MIFRKNTVDEPDPEKEFPMDEVEMSLLNDRAFWDACVFAVINEDDTVDQSVRRATEVADRLLEVRRGRFPLKG
jgi:hypothetical protein